MRYLVPGTKVRLKSREVLKKNEAGEMLLKFAGSIVTIANTAPGNPLPSRLGQAYDIREITSGLYSVGENEFDVVGSSDLEDILSEI